MKGEFKVNLKTYDPDVITRIFVEHYGDKLQAAFNKCEFFSTGSFQVTDFYAGHHADDSLFLVWTRESTILKIYIETVNGKDLKIMKDTVNKYFAQVVEVLRKNQIKWSSPSATITLEDCPFEGVMKTRKSRLKEIWEKQKEKFFVGPIAAIVASFLGIYLNLLNVEEFKKEFGKTLTLTVEAYVGLLLSVLLVVLFSPYKKRFTFSF